MSLPSDLADDLRAAPRRWLVTGAAGFIGSHLVETLLAHGQTVVGMDNLSTGSFANIEEVGAVAPDRFRFERADIRNLHACRAACASADIVLHQAALGSVPRSIQNPLATHANNIDGTLNMLVAARDAGASRFVFASSSSVYGDHVGLPKVEDQIGAPLSPYAISKRAGEMYARTFFEHYGLETIGLRYFNVFGPRQDPNGPYAAVIPRWVAALVAGETCAIHGDGSTSRDFCFVANVVQANLRAALAPAEAAGQVYNVAVGDTTSLNDLYRSIGSGLVRAGALDEVPAPTYGPFRVGDILHSLADVSAARERLGYAPTHTAEQGLEEALAWYVENLSVSV